MLGHRLRFLRRWLGRSRWLNWCGLGSRRRFDFWLEVLFLDMDLFDRLGLGRGDPWFGCGDGRFCLGFVVPGGRLSSGCGFFPPILLWLFGGYFGLKFWLWLGRGCRFLRRSGSRYSGLRGWRRYNRSEWRSGFFWGANHTIKVYVKT